MITCLAAAAVAAALIAGPAVSADPAPSVGSPMGGPAPYAGSPGGDPAQPDTVVRDLRYTPTGAGDGPRYAPVDEGPRVAPVAMPFPGAPVPAGPMPYLRPRAEPKQAVYHLKGKDGVRHDVVVVPISDDPSKPITLPDFGFQKFKVSDKPYDHRAKHRAKQQRERKHRQGGKAHKHRRHR
ncbi:hypothetical protein [Microbispora sp. H11081]|uniref:hypothetical protein n=1 Tax=Microbispora sp. H11081 TaxID=2729107 RepID=UPI001472B0AF|nr:hypothetical protein [Microbispora sp. H11081]